LEENSDYSDLNRSTQMSLFIFINGHNFPHNQLLFLDIYYSCERK